MVESLIAGKAVLVNKEDRTQVVNIKEWNISKDDIVHIYDHGGHWIYSITTPLFVSKDSILFLVHDVTKVQPQEINKTTEVLRLAFHQYPDNKIYIIFTHTDLIDANQLAQNSDVLMDTLEQYLDDEISNLNKLLIQKKTAARQDIVDDTAQLLQRFKEKRSNLPVFSVSSQDYSGIEEVKQCLMTVAKEKRTVVPESWVEFYKQILETKKIYLTLNEIEQLGYGSEFLVPLHYFSDSNLCLHYENNPFLKNYVFPDIDFLLDLFKSLFCHNLAQKINYDNEEKVQAIFQKGELDLAIHRYESEGLLSSKLLSYLWEQYGLSFHDQDVLLHLMQSFNLCYSISKDEPIHYFPWFVKSQEPPKHIDRDHLKKYDKDHAFLQLQCKFFNRIPLNVFEMISVCLQRKATQHYHYVGDRYAWEDGLEVSFGSVQCILSRSKHNSTIDVCLFGEVNDLPQVWSVIESLFQDLDSTLKPLYGVIRSIHFICRHCIIFQKSKPYLWLPGLVFPKKDATVSRYVKCPNDPSLKVPAALVIHAFQGKIFCVHNLSSLMKAASCKINKLFE